MNTMLINLLLSNLLILSSIPFHLSNLNRGYKPAQALTPWVRCRIILPLSFVTWTLEK